MHVRAGAGLMSLLVALAVHLRAGDVPKEPPREWIDADTGRRVVRLPPDAGMASVNADETLLAGTITEGAVPEAPGAPPRGSEPRAGGDAPRPGFPTARTLRRGVEVGRDSYPGKDDMMERRLAAR